jgi:hypothetical protein
MAENAAQKAKEGILSAKNKPLADRSPVQINASGVA